MRTAICRSRPRRPDLAPGGLIACALALGDLWLGGCRTDDVEATRAGAASLGPAASAYVAVPEDGRFGTRVYAGSGAATAALIARSVLPYLSTVAVAAERQPRDRALPEARVGGFTYLILPTIVHWEDHAEGWAGLPDWAKILVEVVHSESGRAADLASVEGRGEEARDGAGQPHDLLDQPLRRYAARLFHQPLASRRP